ncbi:MAG: methyltransferase domain-containing protein [Deltaproteobacteria bacterium]|nr:methyltransferase domain-containing protein [Deltaproteobacteria bacterium]
MSNEPSHSASRHLALDVADYDAQIRRLVPYYGDLLREGVAVMKALAPPAPRVLDLGGGTGALAEAVLEALPEATVTVLDVDPEMLAVARGRLARFGGRAVFVAGRFTDALPLSDVVVSSLALHHVPDIAQKTAIFRAVNEVLYDDGLFLNLDATMSADPALTALAYDHWLREMGARGVGEAEARGYFAAWAEEDTYLPLADELAALRAAGFPHPECFWRRGPATAYGARKID